MAVVQRPSSKITAVEIYSIVQKNLIDPNAKQLAHSDRRVDNSRYRVSGAVFNEPGEIPGSHGHRN